MLTDQHQRRVVVTRPMEELWSPKGKQRLDMKEADEPTAVVVEPTVNDEGDGVVVEPKWLLSC